MKKIIFFITLILLTGCQQTDDNPEKLHDHQYQHSLLIFWSTDEYETFDKVIYPYALNSINHKWWDEVELLIWGPSVRLLQENTELQRKIVVLKNNNITLTACLWCADQYNATPLLESLGVDVHYMGKSLTDYLQGDRKILTF